MDGQRLRKEYDKIAEEFDRTRVWPWDEVVSFLSSVGPFHSILDAGCGNGRHLRLVENRCKLAVGLDFSKKLLELARKKVMASFVCGDVVRLPFKNESFHIVILVAVLHHLPTQESRLDCLKELRRVLKHGGKILLSVWSRDAEKLRILDENVNDAIVSWGGKAWLYYHVFNEKELELLARNAGFKDVVVWTSGANIWLKAEN